VVGDTALLVSATRSRGEVALQSATGESLGRVGDVDTRPAAQREATVDGVPVDPADIESLLRGSAGVISCSVRWDPDERLRAVIETTAMQSSVRRLNRILRSSLPEAMVPRLTLTETEMMATTTTQQQHLEREIRRLWSLVLKLRDVPVDTPFFDLGGDSLLLFSVLDGLRKEGWTNVAMTDLFAYPTVRSLSIRLAQPEPAQGAGSPGGTQSRREAMAARRGRRTT
jgi:acyl carrier protein